jgi:hypothetical protein
VYFVVCTLAVKKKIRAGFYMSDRTIPLSVSPYPKTIKKNKRFRVSEKRALKGVLRSERQD